MAQLCMVAFLHLTLAVNAWTGLLSSPPKVVHNVWGLVKETPRLKKIEKQVKDGRSKLTVRQLHGGSMDDHEEPSPRYSRFTTLAVTCLSVAGIRLANIRRRSKLVRRARGGARGGAQAKGLNFFSPLAFKQWTSWPTEIGAGVTTAVVALPLAMAFGVASGAGPLAGLYGAIFTGFFAALFGGTPAQVTGPTGPMTVIMASVIAQYGNPAIAFFCVSLSGLIQILMGTLKLGGAIRLVPVTVLSGFMSGIGGIICSLQLPVLLGHSSGGDVVKALTVLPKAIASPNVPAFSIGLVTLFILYKLPQKLTGGIPRPLLALVAACVATAGVLPALGITVPCLAAIPMGIPMLSIPTISASMLGPLFLTALTLAVLGAIDSLLTSLVSDSMTSSFHDSDRELFGQGIGNFAAGLFGGSAGAGATMRTVVNVRTGGRTPVSGAAHSVVLLAFVTLLGPLAKYIPTSCLAAILIKSGLDVVDWNLLQRIKSVPKAELAIMLITFGMTVFVDLIAAVAVGWALAVFIFFYKSSKLALSSEGVEVEEDESGASVVYLKGMVTFGAATGLLRELVPKVVGKKAVVIDFSKVTMLDTSAVLSMEELLQKVVDAGGKGYVCGAQSTTQGFSLLEEFNLIESAANESISTPLADVLPEAKSSV